MRLALVRHPIAALALAPAPALALALAPALALALVMTAPAAASAAEAPRVVASIKPVHSLVAQVMEGVGTPDLLLDGAASPHDVSLKPSQAAALQGADAIVWIGPDLETFLVGPLESLAGDARTIALQETDGLLRLSFREGGPFEAHSHAHEGHDHEHEHEHEHEHSHDDDHGHDEHAHDDHDHDQDHGHDHSHDHDHGGHDHTAGGMDGHYWLDPQNAIRFVERLAAELSALDPAHAETYRANATAAAQSIEDLAAEIDTVLAPVRDKPFLVFHDAYQYLETRFDLRVAGSITVIPDVMPGARRVSELREKVRDLGATCVFAEPQFEPRLVSVVVEDTPARSGVLDPLGSAVPAGVDHYSETMRANAQAIRDCLSEDS